jgi:basic membrane protein A
LLLALLVAFGLIAAACGDDDDDTATTDGAESEETEAPAEETEAPAEETEAPAEETEAPAEETEAPAEETEAPAEPADGVSVGLVYDIGGRGDQSFNDAAFAGLERAAADFGITFTEASPNEDGSNRAELLQLAADANPLVIAVGFLFEADAAAVGGENPGVNFGVIDSSMIDFSQDPPAPYGDNIAGLVFSEEQGSFLVGAAAALKSQTGTIGFIGGVSGVGGLIEKFEAGYRAGALAVNPDIEIFGEYITAAPDFDGFNAPDRAKEIATGMYEDGADIIYHAAGGSGAGMFQAAADFSAAGGSKVWGIGVDSDQYNTVDPSLQEYVLTSMLKRVDVAVYEVIRAHIDGTIAGGETRYDLAVDGVGYSTSGGFVDDIADQLEEFKAQIIDGTIVVPTDPAEVG